MLRPRAVGLLLTFITLVVYLPTTSDQFINFDDPVYVLENPFVNAGFSLVGIKWALVTGYASNWHPFTWFSHMLDCELFHLNPAGPHLVNSLLHAINAGLLFVLLLRLTNPSGEGPNPTSRPSHLWACALVAALFAWHPLHVESVAWISERKDVLSTFFSLLSLLSYVRYVRGRATPRLDEMGVVVPRKDQSYVMALIWFALAVFSKPMPVTLPVVMLLLDYWPLGRFSPLADQRESVRKLFCEKIPFFTLSALVCGITIVVQKKAESNLSSLPISLRLENVVLSYAGYLGKMLWPVHLSILYPYDPSFSTPLLVESGLLLMAISALAWRLRHSHPFLITGWLWYGVTLLPVIGLIQVGTQSMADRYTYFPLIGIFIAVAFFFEGLARQYLPLGKILAAAAVTTLAACLILTWHQLSYWHDSVSLFQHAIEVDDNEVARDSLGSALLEKNEKRAAMTQFIVAWRMKPDSVLANYNVAGILVGEKKMELAAAYYQRSTVHNTSLPAAYLGFGRVLVTLNRDNEAMIAFSQAAQLEPESATPHFLMGRLLLEEGRNSEAMSELNKALELEPQNLENMVYVATVLASSPDARIRDGKRALAMARQVVEKTGGQDAAAMDVTAMSCAELGRFADALILEQQAIQLLGAENQPEELELLQKHLESYQKHQAWRQSFHVN